MGLESSGGFFFVKKPNRCEIYCKISRLFFEKVFDKTKWVLKIFYFLFFNDWILCFWVDFCEGFSAKESNGDLEFLGLSCRKH
jgi:hypothetical protein